MRGVTLRHRHEFDYRVSHTLSCSFFAKSDCIMAGVWGLLFNAGYILSFYVALLLNNDSPNYTMIINLLVPCVVSATAPCTASP